MSDRGGFWKSRPVEALVYNRVHRTFPGVVHAPGRPRISPWWDRLTREVFATNQTYGECESLDIITWNSGSPDHVPTSRGYGLGWFERSLAHFGVPHVVLGRGIAAWHNRLKIDLTIEFLRQSTRDFVLGGDSSDVLLVADPRSILEAYRRQMVKILFNAEKFSWPVDATEAARFEESVNRGPFQYLNSGVWIGRREDCLRAFQAAKRWADQLTDHPRSDQFCWRHAYQELYPDMQIDWRCEVFQCVNFVTDEIKVRGRTSPRSILHSVLGALTLRSS